MLKSISYLGLLFVAYKVILFVLSLLDAMNKCGALEFCK